ncbi:MAG: GNAT family N-acetyltransferase [Pseudomonadota bacterium]
MTRLTLASTEDLDRLLPLVAAFHEEMGIEQSDETRLAALAPLLDGSPHGCVYLAGPSRAPVGYAAVSFGWSIEFGGLDGYLDELYIRQGVRGRGLATEILTALPETLAEAGLRAMHLEVSRANAKTIELYRKRRFEPREQYMLMSRRF